MTASKTTPTTIKPCTIPLLPPAENTVETKLEPSSGQRLYLELMRRNGMLSSIPLSSSEDFARKFSRLYESSAFMSDMAKVAGQARHRVRNFNRWFARTMPSVLGNKNLAQANRKWLLEMKEYGEHFFDRLPFWSTELGEGASRYMFTKHLEQHTKWFEGIAKRHNLNRHQRAELVSAAVELGNDNRIANFAGSNQWTRRAMERERTRKLNRLREFGLVENEINEVLRRGDLITGTYDEALAFAEMFGVKMDRVEGIGYMSRLYSEDANWRLAREQSQRDNTIQPLVGDIQGARVHTIKSRETWEFVRYG